MAGRPGSGPGRSSRGCLRLGVENLELGGEPIRRGKLTAQPRADCLWREGLDWVVRPIERIQNLWPSDSKCVRTINDEALPR